MKTTMIMRVVFALLAGASCLLVGEPRSMTGSASLVSEANAVIGRPLTPVSYAGVAGERRAGLSLGARWWAERWSSWRLLRSLLRLFAYRPSTFMAASI